MCHVFLLFILSLLLLILLPSSPFLLSPPLPLPFTLSSRPPRPRKNGAGLLRKGDARKSIQKTGSKFTAINDIIKDAAISSLTPSSPSPSPPPLPKPLTLATSKDIPMISLLRLSVFSPSPNLTSLFLRKSSQIISTRLTLSSKILLHPTPKGLAGSIEISSHEFSGTSLSGLYLSEFCVKSTERLKGYGSTLLTGVDSYASHINVKSIYLHVEKNNLKAIKCYTRAGYDILLPKDSREVFSSKLGLGEGKHWLMGKGVEEGEILGFDI